jgi:putative membrane protein
VTGSPEPTTSPEPVSEDVFAHEGGEGWRRLNIRMLAVHPVREVLRAWPVLLGLLFFGTRGGNGEVWGLVGIAFVVVIGLSRWYTTTYRISEEQVQVRRGLLRREVLTVPRDRVRTVDVTASPLHRILGLARVSIGTGRSDKREDALKLDALSAAEAEQLRTELLQRTPVAAPVPGAPPAATEAPIAEAPIARLDPAWLRFGPFSLSGLVIVGIAVGFLSRLTNEANLQLGFLESLARYVSRIPLWLSILEGVLAVVLVVAVTSTGAYVVAYWGFRLSRQAGGTLHIVRGLLTQRSITLEERRLRGVEISETLLLRLVRGARCIAVATGLRVGRGAERGGSLLLPPAPLAEAVRVTGEVLADPEPAIVTLVRHGHRARRRRYIRALVTTGVVPVVLGLLWWYAGLPSWIPLLALVLPVLGVPLAEDRYRNLGHALTARHLVVREGSLVRRRTALVRDGIIGWNLRQSFFQRRAGVVTVEATTAAGRQRYAAEDVPAELAVRLVDAAVPDLLTPFLTRD